MNMALNTVINNGTPTASMSQLNVTNMAQNIDSLSTDFDKTLKRQKEIRNSNLQLMDELYEVLNGVKKQLKEDGKNIQWNECQKIVKDKSDQLLNEQKEAQATINKLAKNIDKSFRTGIDKLSLAESFECKGQTANEILGNHFLRQGRFDLCELFCKESHLELPDTNKHQFKEMFNILEAIRRKDLAPAIQWASLNRHLLESSSIGLEFKLHRLQFIHLMSQEQYEVALLYAKKHFGPFAKSNIKEIQRLMGSLLFINRFEKSPYKDLFYPTVWIDIEYVFAHDCCLTMGLSYESPLYVTVMVGAIALPTLMKMTMVMQMKKNEWSQKDELPVEIDLGKERRYHSIFICPVSKEQGREENPPMMMPCGHVICKESLLKLAKGNGKFKCPYCPSESVPSQAKRIYF